MYQFPWVLESCVLFVYRTQEVAEPCMMTLRVPYYVGHFGASEVLMAEWIPGKYSDSGTRYLQWSISSGKGEWPENKDFLSCFSGVHKP